MKAFILAAGNGSRLKPLTDHVPKPLLPVIGRPSICFQLAGLRMAGIEDIIINIHHLGDKIRDFFEHHRNFGFNIHFSEEESLLGTGGALKKCSDMLNEPFLLLNADIVSNLNITVLMIAMEQYKDQTILALSKESLEDKYSVAVKGSRIVDFSGLANSGYADDHEYIGAAIIMPELVKMLPEGVSHIVNSGFIPQAKKGALAYYLHPGWWFDTGTKVRKGRAEKFLQSQEGIASYLIDQKVEPKLSYLFKLYKNISEY